MALVLHERTASDIESFTKNPPHALLLVGPNGSGKRSIAEQMVATIMGRDVENYPYLNYVKQDNGSIKIEAIRELKQFLRLKLPVKADGIRRFAIIEHADTMTPEAQNALLKTLEEPPLDTLLIMTALSERALLETVRSRVQSMTVLAPDRGQLVAHFSAEGVDRAYMLSGGLPGLMTSILGGDGDNDLVQVAEMARQVLTSKPYDRLKLLDKLAKQPDQVASLIAILGRMAHAGLESASRRDQTAIRRWHGVLKSVDEAESALASNGQAKLVLLNLFLNI